MHVSLFEENNICLLCYHGPPFERDVTITPDLIYSMFVQLQMLLAMVRFCWHVENVALPLEAGYSRRPLPCIRTKLEARMAPHL